jgi:hypothetical protein
MRTRPGQRLSRPTMRNLKLRGTGLGMGAKPGSMMGGAAGSQFTAGRYSTPVTGSIAPSRTPGAVVRVCTNPTEAALREVGLRFEISVGEQSEAWRRAV